MEQSSMPDINDLNQAIARISITMRVPERIHREPVISHLVSNFGLVVNITAAVLGENQGDGWFNLELEGTEVQIRSGILYLEERELEIWQKDDAKDNDW